jgi:hypothetical protein
MDWRLGNGTNYTREATWAGGIAQMVEHFPSKCEAQNSNPSTGKKKKEGRKEGRKEGKRSGPC